ncbi:MAG: hypothetical protein KJ604_20310 [Gammaproteobacteria bacterium]|nr:hypothetical protein [Gammaproteobacteria bacterium]
MFTARVNEFNVPDQLRSGVVARLETNGFELGVFQCQCGACDSELVWQKEFASEGEADDFLFDENEEFRV